MIMVSYNVRYRKKRDWKIIYCKNDNKTQTVKHSNTNKIVSFKIL